MAEKKNQHTDTPTLTNVFSKQLHLLSSLTHCFNWKKIHGFNPKEIPVMLNLTFLLQIQNQQDSLISYRMVHLTLEGTKKSARSVILKKVLKAKPPCAFMVLRI